MGLEIPFGFILSEWQCYICYPMPISPLFWGHIHLFSNFTSPQTEKDFAAGWIMCRDSLLPDLDGLR